MSRAPHPWARRSALAALLAVAAGCTTVGPDYRPPPVVLPPSFAETPAVDPALAAIPPDWWRLYGDATLTRLVEQALAANADIAQAVARVELAEAQAREVGGARLPAVGVNAGAGRSEVGRLNPSNPSGQTVSGNDFRAGLSASYEFDFWGRLRRADESARAQLLASAAARDTVRLTVAGAVAQAWFALRSIDEQILVTRDTLATRETGAQLIDLRLRAGTGSGLDAQQAEILRADSALLLRELQRQREVVRTQLGVLTADPALALPAEPPPVPAAAAAPPRAVPGAASGALPGAGGTPGAAPSGTMTARPTPAATPGALLPAASAVEALPLPPAGLPSSLLQRRPDLRRAEEQLVAANAQIGVARAAMFPTLSLTGALGQESGALLRLLDGPARIWSIGFGLALPLFDGGRNAARVDQAGARQREAVAAYQGAVSTAFKEVADALAAVSASRDAARDVDRRATAARRAEQLARARFDAGYSGYLELLDAQRTASGARLEVARNRQAQRNASVDLIKALGGGWSDPAPR